MMPRGGRRANAGRKARFMVPYHGQIASWVLEEISREVEQAREEWLHVRYLRYKYILRHHQQLKEMSADRRCEVLKRSEQTPLADVRFELNGDKVGNENFEP